MSLLKAPFSVTVVIFSVTIGLFRLALSDVVYLKDGRRLEGHLVYRGVNLDVENEYGTDTVGAHEIDRIEKKPHIVDTYCERMKAIDESDAEGYRTLARWCKNNNLWIYAKSPYAAVLRLDPEDKEAKEFLALTEDGEYFQKLRQLDDSKWQDHLVLGKWCMARKKNEYAQKHFLRALELNPHCQEAEYLLKTANRPPPPGPGGAGPRGEVVDPGKPQPPPEAMTGLLDVDEAEKILKRKGTRIKDVLAEENRDAVKKILLCEDFSDNRFRWPLGKQELSPRGCINRAIQRKSYVIWTDVKDFWCPTEGIDATWNNFIAWFQMALDAGGGYGIILRDRARAEICTFRVLSDGSFVVSVTVNGQVRPMVSQGSEYIRRGADSVNFIEIKCLGTAADFYVNRAHLYQMDTRTPDIGFDFVAGPGGKFRLDNMIIFQISSKK